MAAKTNTETPTKEQNRAQDNVLRARINEQLRDHDLPDLDKEEEMQREEEEELEAGIKVNIFDHCAQFVTGGDVIQYDIEKDGQFVAMKRHPYSWELIQQEFGEGHYRVQAKSGLTKQYRKQETRFVGAASAGTKSVSAMVAEELRNAMPKKPEVDPMDQFAKFATIMQAMTPKQDSGGNQMVEMFKTVIDLQTKSQESTNRLIEKMQETTTKMIEKVDSNTKELIGKLESKLDSGGGKKSMDAIQMLDMLQKAEKRGMDNYMLIESLAEKKAARMNGNDEDKPEESATERMIKSAMPAITAALSQPRQQPQSFRPVQRQMAQPRNVTPVPNPPAPRPAVPTVKAQPQARPQPKAPAVMPRVTKDEVMEKLAPIVIQHLLEAKQVEEDKAKVALTQKAAANQVVLACKPMGLTPDGLLTVVGLGDIIDLATSAGLPVEAHAWLEGFYANLTQLSGRNGRTTGPAAPAAQATPGHPQKEVVHAIS